MTTAPYQPDELDAVPDTGRLDHASRLRVLVVLLVMVLATEVVPMQYTMIAPALQKMTGTFRNVGGNINWVVILIGLVGAAATPLLGKMSDIWGKKRLFVTCLVLFIAGALIDALTGNWPLFLIGRGLQAFAVATQFIAYGLIRDLMPRKYVAIGLGCVGAGLGVSGALAPVIGGYLLDHFHWRSMFWFLAVFTVAMTVLVLIVVPESKLRTRERLDPVGAILLSAGALLTLLYLDEGQSWGWGRPTSLAWLIGGLVLLALFFVVESRVRQPIMNIRLLLNPNVGTVLLMAVFGIGIVAVQPLALGYMTQTPDAAGLRTQVAQGVVAQAHQMAEATLPMSVVHVVLNPGYSYGNGFTLLQYALHVGIWAGLIAIVFGPIGGWLAHRMGARLPAIVAFVVLVLSGLGFALLPYSWATYAGLYMLAGIGFGFFYAAAANLVVDAVPADQQGISTGMLGVTMNIGSAVCLAVVSALQNANPVVAHIDVMGHHADQVIPAVFADRAYTESFWVVLGTTLIALVLAVLMRHGRTPATGGAHRSE